jgi:hypothetical protein
LTHHSPAQRPADGLQPPWSWCGRCQRAYLTGTDRVIHFASDALHPRPTTLKLCPYEDCSASTSRYGWQWASIRLNHPEYPARPERNVVYAR